MDYSDFLKELRTRIRRTFLQLKETDIEWKKTIFTHNCVRVHYLLPYREAEEVFEYYLDSSIKMNMDYVEIINKALINDIRELLECMQLTIRETLDELDKV